VDAEDYSLKENIYWDKSDPENHAFNTIVLLD
jgi:hypothetical protein